MNTPLRVTSIRIDRTPVGWCVIRCENGEEIARQDFSVESDAESWAEGQRILLGNFVTTSPLPSP